ncbi:helix-turn-helix transcriptional regulator, partial [Streptomyces sp. NPDC058964]|uniref:helix-turn-helix transcriptional regulator n=1 Tax=Streptomyces sp. NPDC058964 TaxID=3346681 RepID=UPI0036BB2E4C
MRAARLIKMVLLLQSRTSMTAAELARELEVSERTVTRDAQALSEAGVPVYADRGRAGGYRLIGGYRTRLTGLARSEAEALFLSGVPGALREMGLEDAASAARLKVSAALLPSLSDASRTAAQRFHLDAPAWFRDPETPELLPAFAEAVWDDRCVTARYRHGGAEVERTLEPYGLVLKAGVWYLCARVPDTGGHRTYRLDRFTAVGGGRRPGRRGARGAAPPPGGGGGANPRGGGPRAGGPGGRAGVAAPPTGATGSGIERDKVQR